MRWIFLLLTLWPAAAAGTGCSSPEEDPCGGELCGPEGERRCRGSKADSCNRVFGGGGYDDTPWCEATVWEEFTDCESRVGAECADGACVLRAGRCPDGALGFCENGSVRRCQGNRLLADKQDCEKDGLTCFDVVRTEGETDGVCALRDEPCRQTQGYECHGERMVECARGYTTWERVCPANERCSDSVGFPQCGLDVDCPADGSTLCSGNTVYGCRSSSVPAALRDCATTGSICTSVEGRALCASSATEVSAPTFLAVAGGTFAMGPPGMTHEVTVSSFEMMEREVTVGAYAACVRGGACAPAAPWTNAPYSDVDADLPVTGVSDEQAMLYCSFLEARLPFESEWEFAMRNGGLDVPFPWGSERATCEHAILRDSSQAAAIGCGRGEPWPGCSREGDRTSAGICDLAGNVDEFVRADGGVSSTILRGSNARDTPPTDLRWPGSSRSSDHFTGFRCVRSG
jgi:formylglycine-generating enzyme required for sulfatase activity